ncbi:MAG: type II and III secretion system protein family protein [Proteobacteria bacterium]|nr:type II and III secretion system protein family protein [Pseudomonadota bacterium]
MTGGLRIRIAAICSLAMFAATAAAQQVPQSRSAAPAARTASERAAPKAPSPVIMEITVNKTRAVSLPSPVEGIIVGNEGIADVNFDADRPRQVFVIARGVGTTDIIFTGAGGRIIHQLDVRVVTDHVGIEAALAQLLPEQDINVAVFRDTVFLTGTVRTASDSANAVVIARRFVGGDANVINMLDLRGSQQVILQVRVSEMARTVTKNFAVNNVFNWELGGQRVIFSTTGPGFTDAVFATGNPLAGFGLLGKTQFDILEKQGLTKTLAEPTLTVLSGETATFLAGGETPIPSGVDQSGNLSITYREFGIRLEFTPVVIAGDRINLRLITEISSVDATNTVSLGPNVNIPTIISKRTETTIDLPSGGTVMIAGLIDDNMSNSISGFPFLKDIPVIGALFRSTEFTRGETELVITVTAYLAKPVGNKNALSLPTDGFEPASDIDFFLLGRLHREYAKGERDIWAETLKGPFGYFME